MIKQLKGFGLAALTASTLLFSAAPQAQAKNYYCRETDNGIGYCFARTGYERWTLTIQDKHSYDGVSATVNCLDGHVQFRSVDGFNRRGVTKILHQWCLDQM